MIAAVAMMAIALATNLLQDSHDGDNRFAGESDGDCDGDDHA